MQYFSPNYIRVDVSSKRPMLDAVVLAYIGERHLFYFGRPKAYATTVIIAKALGVSASSIKLALQRLVYQGDVVFAEFERKRVYYTPPHLYLRLRDAKPPEPPVRKSTKIFTL